MTDILNGAQKAVYQRLVAQLTGTAIVEHAEQNKPAPFVLIESISSEDVGGKDGGLELLTITLMAEAKAKGRKACQTLMAAAEEALTGWTPVAVDGVKLSRPRFQSKDVYRLDEADRYFGQVRVQAFAQAG